MSVIGKTSRTRPIPAALSKDRDVAEFMAELLSFRMNLIPTGGRIDWFGATAPVGFVFLSGQTLALPQYQDLADSGQSDITVGATSITLPTIASKVIKF